MLALVTHFSRQFLESALFCMTCSQFQAMPWLKTNKELHQQTSPLSFPTLQHVSVEQNIWMLMFNHICVCEIDIYWQSLKPLIQNVELDGCLSPTALPSSFPAAPTDWHWGVQTRSTCPHWEMPDKATTWCYEVETEHKLLYKHTAVCIHTHIYNMNKHACLQRFKGGNNTVILI